ncbi:alpha/beta fold hydrolase [Allokutzneria sp. NRRL B-24872]|uniref:alpha/beta fold hydrolase n=1 Tax=Allokutzneria sp. NRRL B-24872 TaxID=1137961 RepID=UPI001FF02F5C|nr:alpha/beta hydrolase [Allokutzneria sp. NRRL B-24872]
MTVAMIEANGIRLHVQRMAAKNVHPDGTPTVVFIHGLGTDSLASFYFTLAAPVSAAGMEVLAFDLRGHGRSGRPERGYQIGDFVGDLHAMLEQMDVQGPVHLVGNSFGGTVAFSYAVAHPERVASIVMIESEPATPAWSAKLGGLLGRAAEQLRYEEAFAWITENQGAHTSRLAKAASNALCNTSMATDIPASHVHTAEEIESVTCPVLAIFGSESDLAVQAQVMETRLERCRSVIVGGHEHSVLVEAPKTVRDLLLPWVAEHEGLRVLEGTPA